MSDLGFDEMAEFYRYRTPYNKNIFPGIAKELGFDPSTIILDLACGDGPLSVGISSYVGRVIAVDSSSVMLTRARKAGNVEYLQNDLAKDGVACSPRANHVFIGRAIQYLPPHILEETFENSLLPEAKVLIFGSAFTASEPWVPAFRALRRSYGETTVGELTGDRALASVGYKRVNTIHSQWTVRVTEEHLVKNTLSYGSCTKNVLADLPRFRAKLRKILEPYLEEGTVNAKIHSAAIVYGQK